MADWAVERIVHFERGDFVKDGLAHFGFHVRDGSYYAVAHREHRLARVGGDGAPEWTVAAAPVVDDVPNIRADLDFPMFVDVLPDSTLLVSNFGSARLFKIDPRAMSAHVLVDGRELGLVDMGNCVVADDGTVWVNEVRGCRVWQFDASGHPLTTVGDGVAGFEGRPVRFDAARFNWIYDLRRGPDASLYVLDSRNFALRVIDIADRSVRVLAGDGTPGDPPDGAEARGAVFGSDPTATFDGPISLAVDERGNAYVGDRFNGVVKEIRSDGGAVTTIAGRPGAVADEVNEPSERDPLRLNLPLISSMDYADGRLFVPTDLADDAGDLAVLRRVSSA